MHALKVVLLVLAVATLISAEAKKSSKKVSSKAAKPDVKDDKDSKTHKRGLYPEPVLGSAYIVPGAVPLEVHHDSPDEHLSVYHDTGLYGPVHTHSAEPCSPAVVATYAPGYGFGAGDSSYRHGYLGGFPGGLSGLEALLGGVKIEDGIIRVRTITKHVPVPVPHPVPVEVIKKVPVPVPHKVPVDVPRAVPVEVPQPYPVEVEKPYPVIVPKPVPQLVQYPIRVAVPKPYPVEVPTPYAVEVHKPVPVPVPHHVEVPQPVLYHTAPTPQTHTVATIPVSSHHEPVISVKKCDDDSNLLFSPSAFSNSFAKDLFSVSSPVSPTYGAYHTTPAPSYRKSATHVPVLAPTPAPVYSTITPYVPAPVAVHPTPAPYVPAPAPAYSTVAPYVHAPAPAYSTVAPYVSATEAVYSHHDHDYSHSRGVATSFIGVSGHGSPQYGGYNSEVTHQPLYY